MIPFFRKLRKQLADDNKPIKYMRYAIGEIILVVIGILIALQINNWNSELQAKIETEAHRQSNLQEIYHDLKKDLVVFDTILNQLQRQKEASMYLLQILESEDKFINDSLKFHHFQLEATHSIAVERKNNTWDNLNASGELLTLKDDELNEQLFQYYAFYDSRIKNFNELPKEIRLNNRKVGSPCIDLEDLLRIRESNYSVYPKASWFSCWLSNPGMHGIIISVFESSLWNIDWFTELKTQAQSIIKYIEENLAQEINLNKNP